MFESLIHSQEYKFYLAFSGEEAVASSMLLLSNGIASINVVATKANYKRMGVGTAMAITPLLYAQSKGYKIGVLQASQAGEPVYRKIGFDDFCRFSVYKLCNI